MLRATAIVTITAHEDMAGGFFDCTVAWPDMGVEESVAGMYDVSSCIAWSRMIVSRASNKWVY
jgi:hypothetical protein